MARQKHARASGGPPPSGGRRVISLVGLLLLGIVAGAAILEGAGRLLWKAPWYEELLAVQMRLQTYDYRENRWGLRDQNYDEQKPAGRKRVLMLGDSFTFGMGVPDDRLIFPEILERKLTERRLGIAPDGVEILNAGLPATLTGDWVKTWHRVGPKFDPDLVVVVFFLRDGTETMFIPEFFMRIRANIVARNERSFLYGHSHTYRLLRDRLDRRDIANDYTKRFLNGYFGSVSQTAEWHRARRNLTELRDLTRAHGAKFGLVIFPVLVELDEGYPFQPICDLVVEFGNSIDVPVHNLLDVFMGRDASRLWVSPMDQHPNADGHALVAEALMPFMVDLLSENAKTGD